MHETKVIERALLVMIQVGREEWTHSVLADEFRHLVESAEIEVADCILVKRKEFSSALYIGTGKVEELAALVQELGVNVVIFNDDLRPAQQRNLEDALLVKVIDRTQLILDIFSRHAHTPEGALQVELAQSKYLLPRLKGQGIMLSRLGGGIGTRGPGEKKLEIDRRRITDRITALEKNMHELISRRELLRKKREKEKTFVCSLVGYTSAGKSTLFNSLVGAREKTADSLFTTLDTVSRSFVLQNNLSVLITDTVGFIHKLPLRVIDAFKATLEELKYADVIIHVVDAAASDFERLIKAVNVVLTELELNEKPLVLVFNKTDLLNIEQISCLRKAYPLAVFVSALKQINLDELKQVIYRVLSPARTEVIVRFPFSRMEIVDYIHKNCEVLRKEYNNSEVVYCVRVSQDKLAIFKQKEISVEIKK